MRSHDVRCLLMGGQACIVYGAAEFSRDAHLAVLADAENLRRLATALQDLQAETIAVPPFDSSFLERGHAIHFRCARADVRDMRVDVMARMRGVAPFAELWDRRTTVELPATADVSPLDIDVLSLADLVAAKKTQRDKDWPMIRRLLEAHWFEFRDEPDAARVAFWLGELRTPGLLVEAVHTYADEAQSHARPAVRAARDGTLGDIERSLFEEQEAERERDRHYWAPLRAELEELRRTARQQG
jgi:hypothetical protein